MIHAALTKIQDKIKTQFPEIKKVDYYKGEFEEGVEWNPIFPVVFTNCTQINPKLAGSKILTGTLIINIYTGIKIEDEDQTTLFENLVLFLNSLNEDAGLSSEFVFEIKLILLQGYFYGIEAYRIELHATKKFV